MSHPVGNLPGGGNLVQLIMQVTADPGAIRQIASRWSSAASRSEQTGTALRTATSNVESGWIGDAKEAFAGYLNGLVDLTGKTSNQLESGSGTLEQVASLLETALQFVTTNCDSVVSECASVRAAMQAAQQPEGAIRAAEMGIVMQAFGELSSYVSGVDSQVSGAAGQLSQDPGDGFGQYPQPDTGGFTPDAGQAVQWAQAIDQVQNVPGAGGADDGDGAAGGERDELADMIRNNRYGDRGDEVRDLQERLNEAGYDVGDADGIWGRRTQEAAANYLRDNGLERYDRNNYQDLPGNFGDYRDDILDAANRYDIEPEVIMGIMDRETGNPAGGQIGEGGRNILGDGGHGHGLMQIDDRSHQQWLNNNDWQDAGANIDYGASILRDNLDRYGGDMQAALNAYNGGGRAAFNEGLTTGGNYGTDVLNRADWFREQAGANAAPAAPAEPQMAPAPAVPPDAGPAPNHAPAPNGAGPTGAVPPGAGAVPPMGGAGGGGADIPMPRERPMMMPEPGQEEFHILPADDISYQPADGVDAGGEPGADTGTGGDAGDAGGEGGDGDQAAAQEEITRAIQEHSYGSSGDEVRALQEQLAAQGYDTGPADGDWGPQTQQAIDQFVSEHAFQAPENGVGGGEQREWTGDPQYGPSGPPPDVGYSGTGAQVDGWIAEAQEVLRQYGVNDELMNADDIRLIIEHESSNNPHAINDWDRNWDNHIPSKGLMQTIDPTFNGDRYPGHVPGYADIYNPVDNIIAGVRYSIARYGSISDVPGVESLRSGGGYAPY